MKIEDISIEEAEANYQKMEELLANQKVELQKTKKKLNELIEQVRKEKELKKKGEN